MGFSKKVATQGTSSEATGDWGVWNESIWNAMDVTATVDGNGKEIKETSMIGTLKFIMELGNVPQDDASMTSTLPVPKGDEENSAEELAKIKEYPTNYFTWETEYKKGEQPKQVRKVHWPVKPQEALVLAVDFKDLSVDYGLHPAAPEDAPEDIRPFRIDYNGKFQKSFERNVINEVNWKTGLFTPKDIKYQITKAIGCLAEYQADGHDFSYLVDATCNWTVLMTKNEREGKVYYNFKIKTPTAIQDIKTRNDTYTAAQQIEDSTCTNDFCGIFFDGAEEDYTKEDCQQIRTFWLEQAQKAVEFDKNKGTPREANGTWLEGKNYADSGLARAMKKFGLDSTDKSPVASGAKKVPPKPTGKKVEAKVEPKPTATEPEIDFDDDQLLF